MLYACFFVKTSQCSKINGNYNNKQIIINTDELFIAYEPIMIQRWVNVNAAGFD